MNYIQLNDIIDWQTILEKWRKNWRFKVGILLIIDSRLNHRYEKKPILLCHFQSKYPVQSRSSYTLKDRKELNTRKLTSPYSVFSKQKWEIFDSSNFSISSSSSSHLDCAVQEPRSLKVFKVNTLKSNNSNEETPSIRAKARFFTPSSCGLSPNGISSSKEARSQSSHSPAKRRRDSPRGKIYRDSSSSANRDGWLYTQQHSGDHKPTDSRSRQRWE